MNQVRTAVIPAAGLGTRMLPASQAIPKELLPVGGRVALDWTLVEAATAGISRIIVVSNPAKPAIEQYLERIGRAGKLSIQSDWLPSVPGVELPEVEIEIVHQHAPKGLGDAVLIASRAAGDGPLAVLLPDEIMTASPVLFSTMLEHFERTGRSVVSLIEVEEEETSSYGCAKIADEGPPGTLAISGFVEKPRAGEAPSCHAISGRYVLGRRVINALASVEPDARGEIQLTSALSLAAAEEPFLGVEVTDADGRFDVGSWSGWLEANLSLFRPVAPTTSFGSRAPLESLKARVDATFASAQAG